MAIQRRTGTGTKGYGGTPWQTVAQALAQWQEAQCVDAIANAPGRKPDTGNPGTSTQRATNRAARPQDNTAAIVA